MREEIQVEISTEEIAEYFTNELIKRGYVPAEEEVYDLSDIVFDYLISKGVLDEIDEEVE